MVVLRLLKGYAVIYPIKLWVVKRIATSLWYRMHVMMYSGAHLSNVCSLKAISTSPLLWLVWRRSNPKPFKSRIWCLSTRARLRNPRQHFKIMISIAKNVRMKPAKSEHPTPKRTRDKSRSWNAYFFVQKNTHFGYYTQNPFNGCKLLGLSYGLQRTRQEKVHQQTALALSCLCIKLTI